MASPDFAPLGMDGNAAAVMDDYTPGSSSDEEENYYIDSRTFQQRLFANFKPVF